ncbi:hypothetical protein H6F77_26665 [Microcoleus sp. FACHB-831]|uniref:hypothetical protein n=1 Tax=Microcoleus sp. FACHB-831 TaxID=2692827 RepID=UPI00168421B2|nr:hypothetical protein [Microcoleus sp. FACHB-831]MBD1924614.1 hypothetical protein [Microcoleus sp. FACHB-831]
MKAAIKQLASISLMLIFTFSGFVVLVVSIALMVAESVVGAVLTQVTALKKVSSQECAKAEYITSD